MTRFSSVLITVGLAAVLLAGCASQPDSNNNSAARQLYDGRPIETLSVSEAPKSEKEAIMRGDQAMREGQSDLALFEYISSLEFKPGQYRDKTFYTIGRIHESRENYALAQKAYMMALDENPNNVQVLEQLGENGGSE